MRRGCRSVIVQGTHCFIEAVFLKISSPSPLDVYPCYQKLLGPVGAPANGIVSKTLGSDGATDASLDMTTTLR
jgi:hypothetical protein